MKAEDNQFPYITGAEQAADPSVPAAGTRKLFPKADGWYDQDDAGVLTGPLGTGSGGGGGGGGYTTPTVVGAAFNRGSSNAPNCTIPAGVEPGDILVAFVGSNYATSAAPAGWVLVAASNNNQHNSAVMVRSADGTESGTTPASSLSGSEPWVMHIVVVRGSSRVVRGNAVQSSNTVASVSTTFGTSAASVSPSIGPHDLVLALGSFRSTGAAMSMTPAGTTVTTDNAATGNGESIVTASSGNGLSTTFTASHAASTTGVALAILALSA